MEDMAHAELVGEVETTLGEIVGSPGQQLSKSIKTDGTGSIVLRTEEINDEKEKVVFTCLA
jgi:hypothetical protein